MFNTWDSLGIILVVCQFWIGKFLKVASLKLTFLPLKMDAWNISFWGALPRLVSRSVD